MNMKRAAAGLLAGVILTVAGCERVDTDYSHSSAEEEDTSEETGGGFAVTEDVSEQEKTEQASEMPGYETADGSAETTPAEGIVAIPLEKTPNWSNLLEVNPDTRGWITIPGTSVDSVVVQGEDNEYYQRHDFFGNENEEGTVFADEKCGFFTDKMPDNTILYGSGLLNRYNFSELSSYSSDIDFLKKNPVVSFDTLYRENKYKIIAVFLTNSSDEQGEVFDYTNYVYFKDSDEFYNYILEVMDRSIFETGVDVEYGDQLLTLSTCDTSTGIDDMRLVIVARKVREGESPEVDTSKITRKDSVKYCEAYTQAYGDKWKGRTWDISLVRGMKEYLGKRADGRAG